MKKVTVVMKSFLRASALAALAVCGCATAGAQVFYEVSGNGLAQPSWLFGTHHLAPHSYLDRFAGLTPAFDAARAVVGEIDMTADPMQLGAELQQYMAAPPDSTLTTLFTPDELKELNKKLEATGVMPGARLEMFNALRPMAASAFVAMGLIQKSMPSFKPGDQLDSMFQTEAKQGGKEIIALETVAQQGELLYRSVPIKEQAESLRQLLDNPDEAAASAAALNTAYELQDLEAMMQLTREGQTEAEAPFMDNLLKKRNAAWLRALPGIMAGRPSFIAVGALHLAGPDGLVEGLRQLGYTVTPKDYNR